MEEELLLDLDDITVDPDIQDRDEISEEVIDDYAEKLHLLPPVVVVFDGTTYWLAAGHHRYAAHMKAGKKNIACIVKEGSKDDAILEAVRSNTTHGKRRTNEDKRRAAKQLLTHFKDWSDRKIAEEAQVVDPMVAVLRREICPAQVQTVSTCADGKRVGKDGKSHPSSKKYFNEVTIPWIKALIKQDPERSGRSIAAEVKCGSRSVDKIRKQMNESGEIKDDESPAAAKKAKPRPSPSTNGHAAEPDAAEKKADPDIVRDGIGGVVPPRLIPAFTTAQEAFKQALATIKTLANQINQVATQTGGQSLSRQLQLTHRDGKDTFKSPDLKRLTIIIEQSIPFVAHCPACRNPGVLDKPGRDCLVCFGLDWIGEKTWDGLPADLKAKTVAEAEKE